MNIKKDKRHSFIRLYEAGRVRFAAVLLCAFLCAALFAGAACASQKEDGSGASGMIQQMGIGKELLDEFSSKMDGSMEDAEDQPTVSEGTGKVSAIEKILESLSRVTLKDVKITLSEKSFVYNGKAHRPDVRIRTKSGKTLTQDVDYKVTYIGNIDVGTATVKAAGIGKYKGTVVARFKITAASVAKATIKGLSSQVYNGKEHRPKVTITRDGRKLVPDVDYTVSYSNNVNVGTATVTITGIGNYTRTVKKTFSITAASVAKATIKGLSSQVYNGREHTPDVTIRRDGRTLVPWVDYTISYSSNVNVGTATVTITGIGNYTRSVKKTFKITAASVRKANISGISDKVYNGQEHIQDPYITRDGRQLIWGYDYMLYFRNNVNAGTATITIEGIGNYTGTVKKTFKITQASVAKAEIKGIGNQTYTGSEIVPGLTVSRDGRTLVQGVDYTVSCRKNRAVGTAEITITGQGNYTRSVKKTFKIVPRTPSIATIKSVKEGFYITWKRGPEEEVTGYQVEYSQDENFDMYVIKTLKKEGRTDFTADGIAPGDVYFVRLRSFRKVGDQTYYSGWSPVEAVEAK